MPRFQKKLFNWNGRNMQWQIIYCGVSRIDDPKIQYIANAVQLNYMGHVITKSLGSTWFLFLFVKLSLREMICTEKF